MKILIYGLNYRPEPVGVAKYTTEMAEWLVAQGHEVSVVTAPPHYPQWAVPHAYRGSRYAAEQLEGVSVLRCPMWLPKRYSPFKRILSVISFAMSSFWPLLRAASRRPERMIVIEPSFFSVPGAWIASRLLGIPLWLHVQDFELGAAGGLGLVRGRALLRLAAAVESWFLRRPDRVSTLSEPMLERLARAGVPKTRQVLFPNWVDCEEIQPLPRPSEFRAELGIPQDRIVLMYSGSFGRKHGLELLIAAARRLRERQEFQFVLCGEGVERQGLHAQSADLQNVIWLPLQPSERLNDLLNLADVHLLPQRTSVASAVLPSKLTGMLASGRPVIATAVPGTRLADIVQQTGVVVPPQDVEAFAQAALRLGGDAALRRELGIAARRFAESHYGKEQILRRFELQLRETPGSAP